MKVILSNEYGRFEMGGGEHSTARIIEMQGLGIVGKELQTVTFEGQPGRTTTAARDVERTITVSLDFYGGQKEVEALYRIINSPVDILCFFNENGRKISGRCIAATDTETIIHQAWYSIVLQFVCDEPYFHDINDINIPVLTATDNFPNVYENGEWYVDITNEVSATVTSNTRTIVNKGEMRVYPVITITNPSGVPTATEEELVIENLTTKAKITLNYLPKAGESVSIDVARRRLNSSVLGSIIGYMSDNTVLSAFYLERGNNLISVTGSDSSLGLEVDITYSNNYVSAVM